MQRKQNPSTNSSTTKEVESNPIHCEEYMACVTASNNIFENPIREEDMLCVTTVRCSTIPQLKRLYLNNMRSNTGLTFEFHGSSIENWHSILRERSLFMAGGGGLAKSIGKKKRPPPPPLSMSLHITN